MSGWTSDQIPSQSGKTALVTGATSGLGLRSAEALARHGARVILGGRNPDKAESARRQVATAATGPAPEVLALDLADLASVRAAADDLGRRADRLDILMNNAGVMATPPRRTADGFELQFGTNHLGHFALTGLLLPLLSETQRPRIVIVSSTAHRSGVMHFDDLNWDRRAYRKWMAYGQSKLANLLFAFELDRRARSAGRTLVSVAAHPGFAATHLQEAGPEMAGRPAVAAFMRLGNRLLGQPDTQGALPQLYAATMPDVAGGEFWGPDGLFESRGHPHRVRCSPRARRVDDAGRLWDESEMLTGVHFPW